MLSKAVILQAHSRLQAYIKQTPVLQSRLLNQWLGHDLLFKAECLQTTGSFKLRGAVNALAELAEKQALPDRVVANSSGNHAQAVSYAANVFGLPACIYTAKNVSPIKAAATRYYGAELKTFDARPEADAAVQIVAKASNTLWLPPFNHESVIAGQSTLLLDSLEQTGYLNAVFAPCGGGGLLSGTLATARQFCKHTQVIGAEPLNANDAANSLRENKIVSLPAPAMTLADGAATPSVGELTFPYLQKLDAFFEVDETNIAYWTQWLTHLLKLHVEPTSAMTMGAVIAWLKQQKTKQKVLVLLTGGNVSAQSMAKIWQTDYLTELPQMTNF